MYRSFPAMLEGWTKNLALLFVRPLHLAALRMLEFVIIVGSLCSGAVMMLHENYSVGGILLGLGVLVYLNFLVRVLAAHFSAKATAMALLGLPLFVFLLLRSHVHSRVRGTVSWKGRTYPRTP